MKVLLAACLAAVAVTNGVVPAAAADRTAVLKANPKHVNFGTKAVGTFTVKGSTITNIGSSDVLDLFSRDPRRRSELRCGRWLPARGVLRRPRRHRRAPGHRDRSAERGD